MLLAALRRRFTLAIMSMLFLTMFLPLNILPNTAFAQSKPSQCPQGKLCPLTVASHPTSPQVSSVTITPTQGPPGTNVTGMGSDWAAGDQMQVTWDDGTILANTTVQSDGTFTVSFNVPSSAGQGGHDIYFTDLTSRYFLVAVFTVGTCPSSSLTVQTVFTRDGNGNVTSTFAHGAAIQYVVYINNSCGGPITTTFHFVDYWGTVDSRVLEIFNYTFTIITVPSGLSGWYTQSTVPTKALAGGYTDQVQVWDQDNLQDQSTGYGQFTVKAGKLVIPSTGNVTALFLQQPNSETWFPKYYDQNNVLRNSPSGGAHSGVDIAEPNPPTTDCTTGQTNPVYAAAAGLVIWAGFDSGGFGWSVVVKHGYGFRGSTHYVYTLYGHMGTSGTDSGTSKSCLHVKVNTKTTKSTLLGYQGTSGHSTGIHLHFMFFAGNQDVTAAQLSSIYDFVNKYSTYPASPDFYTCMPLTAGDSSPLGQVTYGQNKC